MRWRLGAITALFALACAVGIACGRGGGHGFTSIITKSSFPQGFLPVLLAGSGGSGDVAFRVEGDLFAVAGTSDVTTVSRDNGTVRTFASNVGSASTVLRSITAGSGDDARIFAGDDAGKIWAIAADGSSATLLVDTGSEPITGLAFAPTGFGDFGGSLFAAAGTSGVLRITTGATPVVTTLANTGDRYVDLVFSGTTLFAIDATRAEIDTVSASGTVATFRDGFVAPVGIAVDGGASEIYVADAGDDVLKTVPVAGGAATKRARYDFDPTAPSGIAWDSLGAIAFIASGPLAIRGADLPRVNPANPNYGLLFSGPTVGYGDLEFDRLGNFILAANDDATSPSDSFQNFLFSTTRDGSTVTTLASGVGARGEDLLGVAVDPIAQVIYFSSRLGNVYRRTADGTVSLLVSASASAVLGLELAPAGFTGFGGDLIATTADGRVFAIDPQAPNPPAEISLSPSLPSDSHLSDLVFSPAGVLYLVENRTSGSRILRVAPNGTVTDLAASSVKLGRPDGIEIDEGGHRLLVTAETAGQQRQLLAVDLGSIPAAVTALANVTFSRGFFPTGVVYDRLGTAVLRQGELRQGEDSTSLHAVSVPP